MYLKEFEKKEEMNLKTEHHHPRLFGGKTYVQNICIYIVSTKTNEWQRERFSSNEHAVQVL